MSLWRWCAVVVGVLAVCVLSGVSGLPCEDVSSELRLLPCDCKTRLGDIIINCDKVAFPNDLPFLPHKLNVIEYSQQHSGLQQLTNQLFTASDPPMRKVDFSRNSIRRVAKNVWEGVEDTLEELHLDHNLLGDIPNPIVSPAELQTLKNLTTLNLGYNHIRQLDTGILSALENLLVLHLDGNAFTEMPTAALQGLTGLRVLMMQENDMDAILSEAFTVMNGLVYLNMSHNRISTVQDDAFTGLTELTTMDLSYNRISKLGAQSFVGLTRLEELDLSSNFLNEIPADALKELSSLRTLVLHDNLIQTLGGVVALGPLTTLEHLDLTRNKIGELPPGTFQQLSGLKTLKLGVNSIRKVEIDAFEGLVALETLQLDDDDILSPVHFTALAKVPTLTKLTLDYNRLGVISSDSLRTVTKLHVLSMAHNILREIPQGTFTNFTELENLNLYGNKLQNLVPESLAGLRDTLKQLNLGRNLLSELPQFDFPQLNRLILSKNNITSLPSDAFVLLPELKTLDLSENNLSELPISLLYPISKLSTLDLSRNRISEIKTGQFNESFINVINLQHNEIKEIPSEAFKNLLFLQTLDLNHNKITTIGDRAFLNTPLLYILRLDHNMLPSFKMEIFNITIPTSETELRLLDLSNNDITYLQPLAFQYHSKLNWLSLAHNRLSFFPSEIVRNLTQLQHLSVEDNQINSLENNDFANTPFLRELSLKNNMIKTVAETAFQNSSQLQKLDLSHNKIESIAENTFLGVTHLHLDLSHNELSSFPDEIFHRTKIQKLQSLDLSYNAFEKVPTETLRQQYFYLRKLNMAHNNVKNVQSKADILVNVKNLDLSYNPLTPEAILDLLSEPKTVRHLNLSGTNVTNVPVIEARFLHTLNLSNNDISVVKQKSFEKVSNLQVLDMSRNKIPNLTYGLAKAWTSIKDLRVLDVSENPISYIIRGDLAYLHKLEILKISKLTNANRIERTAFESLRSLRELHLHTFPKLAVLDVRGILESLPGLEVVDIEMTDKEVHDQLHPAFYPRLKSITVRGSLVEALSGGAFAGINSPDLSIGLVNTSVSSLRSSLFFPVPMSSQIALSVAHSGLTSVSPQFISILDSRQRHLELSGVESNPIFCDCNTRPLRSWLSKRGPIDSLYNITCKAPIGLKGVPLTSLKQADLTCEGRPSTTTTDIPQFSTTRRQATTDNIITFEDMTGRPNDQLNEIDSANFDGHPKSNNMDTLIIGIVGGVVAFVALLIIIICIMRIRSDSQYRGGPMSGPMGMHHHHHHGNCTCLKPPPPPPGAWGGYPGPYPSLPPPPSSRAGTLKMMPPPTTPIPPPYASSMGGQSGYYPYPPYSMGSMGYPAESEHGHEQR
ncbi:unnamed protein product [Meganyctiphanes norvegica]|uniref:LRRCT domain-containing protein n=1 Tax=Meganyctiphanes norvegica TaxID=48144 RepID=A0AAV2QBN6_MEGNR